MRMSLMVDQGVIEYNDYKSLVSYKITNSKSFMTVIQVRVFIKNVIEKHRVDAGVVERMDTPQTTLGAVGNNTFKTGSKLYNSPY